MERGCEHCDLDLQKASEVPIIAAYSLMDCDHVYEESKKVRLVLDIGRCIREQQFFWCSLYGHPIG